MSKSPGATPDYILVGSVLALAFFGLVMLASASSVIGVEKFGDSYFYFKRQLVNFFIGLAALYFFSRLPYQKLRRFAFLFLVATIFLLFLVFVPSIGVSYGGARSWLVFGGQPAEIAKLTFLIYLAVWLEKRGKRIEDWTLGVLPFITLVGGVTLLVALQPDIGTMSIIAVSAMAVYFASGAKWRHLFLLTTGGLGLFWLLIKAAPYRAARFSIFLNPALDQQGIGYHINQAVLAVASGGLWGLGLGHSRQKYNFLPETPSDSIFAVIAEELGFFLTLGLIFLFVLIMIRGFRSANLAPDKFGRLLGVGITTWITFQTVVNIGGMLGILPLTGLPLPLISYGGTALITTLAAFGILINISKQARTND